MIKDEYKKYELAPGKCKLKIGKSVTPGTVIGRHHVTNLPVRSELHGQVATIFFNPMHDSYIVLIVSNNN
jgi:hypothetical protein